MDQRLRQLKRANEQDPNNYYIKTAYESALNHQATPYFSQDKVHIIEEVIENFDFTSGVTLVKHDDSDYKGTNFQAAHIRTSDDERFILFNDDHEATSFIWQNSVIDFDLRFNKFAVFELPILPNEITIVPVSLEYIRGFLTNDLDPPLHIVEDYANHPENIGLNFIRLAEGWALFVMAEWGSSEVFETPTEAVWEYLNRTERDFNQSHFDFLNLRLLLTGSCIGEFEELTGGVFYRFSEEAKTTGYNLFAENLLEFNPRYACKITKLASDSLVNSLYAGSEIPGMTF